MPKYVYNYFPLKALGESGRLLLAYGLGDEGFEDNRITREDWQGLKHTSPFGQMPVLEIDGKKYAQSLAIGRYLGRKFGIAGNDVEEDFEIDQNVDFLNDIRSRAAIVNYEPDPIVKERKHEQNSQNVYPSLFKTLDELIKKNNGHVALGRLTWADFIFAGIFEYVKIMTRIPDLEKQYPSFQQVLDNVYSHPSVKAYNDKSPPTDF